MPKPKILQVVTDMRVEGFSDEKIIENLRQLGLKDDQIKKIMQAADQDVYSKFKREMGTFVVDKIQKSRDIINEMVEAALSRRMDKIKKEVVTETQNTVGAFAKTVGDKTTDMTMALKKIREENLKMMEEQKLMRTDIDLLLAGPSRVRLIVSLVCLFFGLIFLAYSVFFVTPQVISLDFTEITDGVILMVTGATYVVAAIVLFTLGAYYSGKPGRQ